jgi:replicative DNA helicase
MLRPPPSNIEAESGLLGTMLIDSSAYHRVADFLLPEHFFEPFHADLYAAIGKIIKAGRRATPAALKSIFEAGKVPSINQLALTAPPARHAPDYARLIYDMAMRRKLVELGEEIAAQAMDAEIDATPDSLIEQAEVALAAMAERGRAQERQLTAADAATEALNVIAAAYQRDGGMAGLPTGLTDLDYLTGGLSPSDLVIIAGRPSMGKTALACGIAHHNAQQGTPVGFFSLEMSAMQIMLRLIGQEVEISANRLRRGKIDGIDYDRILEAAAPFAALPLTFDQSGGITVAQLCARARRMRRQHKVGLIVVDYLQLLSGNNKRQTNRVAEVSEISAALKALAKELEIPVLALSQLSRLVESRDDKRPQLSDLRESGAIEQDADVVMFVYREEYYIAKKEPKKESAQHIEWEGEMVRARGKAELIVEKQRQGPTGTVEAHFNAPLTRFQSLARQEQVRAA